MLGFSAPQPLYVPINTGPAALAELARVDWTRVKHAFGTGPLTYMGTPFDVAASLSEIEAADAERVDEALLSFWDTLCHQGTIYEASARALPFLAAWLAGTDDDNPRADAVLQLIAAIAAAACLPEPPTGSYAGAWGKGVRELTRRALAASMPHLDEARRRQPRRTDAVSLLRAAAQVSGDDVGLASALGRSAEQG